MSGKPAGSCAEAAKPLEGMKVLEMGTLIAGPFCTRILADFGAEVIKVEPPGQGDPLRKWGQASRDDKSLWWLVQSRNKKCVTLNLREKEGQDLARRLAAQVDVLVENFRPGRMEKWGLGYDELKKINPDLIMVRVSGYGQTGPYRNRAGFGVIAEAMGGLRYVTGYPDRPPTRVGISLGDAVAAMFGVIGAVMAAYHRDVRGGKGQCIDVALSDSVFALMEASLPEYDKLGYVRERTGTILPKVAPSNAYETRDGRLVLIGANADTVFRRLASAMGQPELATNPRYATHEGRGEHQQELDELIESWTRQHELAELVELLENAGVPAGPINSIADIADDPHFDARDMILERSDPVWGSVRIPGVVPRLEGTPGEVEWLGPALGEHNQEVFGEFLGLSEADLAGLSDRGVI